MISSVNQGDEFTEVTHGRKKRKASNSPILPSQPKPGSSEPSLGTPVHPKTSYKNTSPVILSGVNEKFKNWRQLMGELRQYHPSLKITRIKELPKGDFLVIGNSGQDVTILQNENTMKAALGKKVKVRLPKAYQTCKIQSKSLAVKGVPADLTKVEFKEFLDLNQITYSKAERLKSKKDGRVLPIFRLKINNPTEAEALGSQNSVCQVTGIVYEVEEVLLPVSIMQFHNCQCFGHLAKTCRSKQKCLICGENHSHKGCPSRKSRKPTCANCKGPNVASYKGCLEHKKQAFRQHVVNNQKSYASALS